MYVDFRWMMTLYLGSSLLCLRTTDNGVTCHVVDTVAGHDVTGGGVGLILHQEICPPLCFFFDLHDVHLCQRCPRRPRFWLSGSEIAIGQREKRPAIAAAIKRSPFLTCKCCISLNNKQCCKRCSLTKYYGK